MIDLYKIIIRYFFLYVPNALQSLHTKLHMSRNKISFKVCKLIIRQIMRLMSSL